MIFFIFLDFNVNYATETEDLYIFNSTGGDKSNWLFFICDGEKIKCIVKKKIADKRWNKNYSKMQKKLHSFLLSCVYRSTMREMISWRFYEPSTSSLYHIFFSFHLHFFSFYFKVNSRVLNVFF